MPDVFSDFVRQRRQELGQTQRQVAQACCVTPEMITQIEAGRRRPDPAWTRRLADALETDRAAFCRLALATWHPLFYSELVGEAIPAGDSAPKIPRTGSRWNCTGKTPPGCVPCNASARPPGTISARLPSNWRTLPRPVSRSADGPGARFSGPLSGKASQGFMTPLTGLLGSFPEADYLFRC